MIAPIVEALFNSECKFYEFIRQFQTTKSEDIQQQLLSFPVPLPKVFYTKEFHPVGHSAEALDAVNGGNELLFEASINRNLPEGIIIMEDLSQTSHILPVLQCANKSQASISQF